MGTTFVFFELATEYIGYYAPSQVQVPHKLPSLVQDCTTERKLENHQRVQKKNDNDGNRVAK